MNLSTAFDHWTPAVMMLLAMMAFTGALPWVWANVSVAGCETRRTRARLIGQTLTTVAAVVAYVLLAFTGDRSPARAATIPDYASLVELLGLLGLIVSLRFKDPAGRNLGHISAMSVFAAVLALHYTQWGLHRVEMIVCGTAAGNLAVWVLPAILRALGSKGLSPLVGLRH